MNTPTKACLTASELDRLERLLGGDVHVEEMVLRFIADKYKAQNLSYLPRHVARQIFMRPADFLRAVKKHCEPELGF